MELARKPKTLPPTWLSLRTPRRLSEHTPTLINLTQASRSATFLGNSSMLPRPLPPNSKFWSACGKTSRLNGSEHIFLKHSTYANLQGRYGRLMAKGRGSVNEVCIDVELYRFDQDCHRGIRIPLQKPTRQNIWSYRRCSITKN